jgi:hypothetical protein
MWSLPIMPVLVHSRAARRSCTCPNASLTHSRISNTTSGFFGSEDRSVDDESVPAPRFVLTAHDLIPSGLMKVSDIYVPVLNSLSMFNGIGADELHLDDPRPCPQSDVTPRVSRHMEGVDRLRHHVQPVLKLISRQVIAENVARRVFPMIRVRVAALGAAECCFDGVNSHVCRSQVAGNMSCHGGLPSGRKAAYDDQYWSSHSSIIALAATKAGSA